MTFRLSASAEGDLEEIGRFTIQRWGVDQAATYVRQLLELIEAVGENMDAVRSTRVPGDTARRYRIGSHYVFARASGGGVDIVRMLHVRMDYEAYLPPA